MDGLKNPIGLLAGEVQPERVQWLGLIFCIGLIALILNLVVRRKIRESYSLIFLGGCVFFGALSLKRSLLDLLGRLVGIYYPPAALFLLISIVFFAFFLHLSMVITRLSDERKVLIQEIALLRRDFDTLQKTVRERSSIK
jgi:hypothetical protein